jgi:hypothetical protein
VAIALDDVESGRAAPSPSFALAALIAARRSWNWVSVHTGAFPM